jgi:gliding motility-associated-like protein
MSSSEVLQNANATVDVSVTNFTDLIGVSFSIKYDSLVLEYVGVSNFNTSLPNFSSGNINPPGVGVVKKGQMTFLWDDGNLLGRTLPSNSKLFTITFKAIGPKGSKSDITVESVPREISISDKNYNEVKTLVNNKGTVTIKSDGTPPPTGCNSPACTNANALTFTGAKVSAKPGSKVCVPFTVKNFKKITSGQGLITWDPALLKYDKIVVPTNALPELAGGLNEANTATGKLAFVWTQAQTLPVTLADNTVIFELCFDVVGAAGKTGCIIMGEGAPESVWASETVNLLPLCYTYGQVNIENTTTNPVIVKLGSVSGNIGETVCVDVNVDNFTKIIGSTIAKISWNTDQLEFVRTDMYNLEGLTSAAFSTTASTLGFNWLAGALPAVTKPNGHRLFQICFKVKQCLTSMPISITGVDNAGEGNVQLTSQATGGAVTCTGTVNECTATSTLGTITNVACNGEANGSVVLNVTGSNLANHNIVWKNAAGTVVKALAPVSSGTNLTNVGAGVYNWEVSISGKSCNTGTATVTQPNLITIPTTGVTTNVGCGQKGAINISATAGGNGGFTYKWSPDQGNVANPGNLNAGTYAVTVTDTKNCSATASFTIANTQTELSTSSSVTNIKCKGGTEGAIQINVVGGCPTISYAWTGGLSGANPQNVKAGTYTVTVTDGSSPAQSKTLTVTITEPAELNIALTGTTETSTATASDGKININITGGTPNYKIVWAGPTTISDGNTAGPGAEAVNLKAGTYAVTVTDANGCSVTRSNIVVNVKAPVEVAPKIGNIGVSSSFNGFGVPCFGNAKGTITGKLSEGTYPVTVNLKTGSTVEKSITVNGPDITFDNLSANSYTVEVVNSKGKEESKAIVITQPTKLAADTRVNCANKGKSDGSIELDMKNSGAGNYGYSWLGQSDTDNKIENLAKGFYNVTITDNNKCTLALTNIEVTNCQLTGECFTASSIITPNGDGYNDLFVINCATDNPSDLSVFDRWGRLVFSEANYNNTFNGEDNNNVKLIEGSYIWVLTVNKPQGGKEVYKGTFTILR